tara:strand:+ start:1362 stop:3164 length:1803 start_codon:yes stop_codon:yes gene_type:complete
MLNSPDFNIWSQSASSGRWSSKTEFLLSSWDFKSSLNGFISFVENSGLALSDVTYDGFAEEFLKRHLDQITSLKSAQDNPNEKLGAQDVETSLRLSGFRRWKSQTGDQLRDVGRLAHIDHGANFSVPGAGKTNCLLAIHSILKAKQTDLKLLIVCPRNALISWDDEAQECLGESTNIVRLQGGKSAIKKHLDSGPQIVAITYQQLRLSLDPVMHFMRTNSVHLVLDESHRIKGGLNSQQGRAAIALAPYAYRRDIMSGTPMPQGVSDIVSQFDFLWPGLGLGAQVEQKNEPEAKLEAAKSAIFPLYVRTTKAELGLPDPIFHYEPVTMYQDQRELYSLLKNEAARYAVGILDLDRRQLQMLGRQVMRLLQFTSDPSLISKKLPREYEGGEVEQRLSVINQKPTAKLDKLDSLVFEIMSQPGSKVVIWSMFVGVVEGLAERYKHHGTTFIHGGVPTGSDDDSEFRESRIKEFNGSPECRILVANPAACGEGISLHKAAHNAIYFDRSYNAAHFLQSVDRIHRRGLPDGVETNVYVLSTRNSIEDSVRDRISLKVRALERLLDDKGLAAMVFDPDDVEEMMPDSGYLETSDISSIRKHLSDD